MSICASKSLNTLRQTGPDAGEHNIHQKSSTPTLTPPSLSPPLPPLPTLSSPAPSPTPSLCCLPPLPSPLSPPSLPRSPARSCSIWECLLGLAPLQCREGQDGWFSTMLWRMVHQEKRVYQVCGFVFVCVGDLEGVAWSVIFFTGIYVIGFHHRGAAVDESAIMDETVRWWVCSSVIFTYLSLFLRLFSSILNNFISNMTVIVSHCSVSHGGNHLTSFTGILRRYCCTTYLLPGG